MEESKTMRVEITTTEIIKPSSPSPNQGCFKLSLLDQFTGHHYVPGLFFYKAGGCGGEGEDVNARSVLLKSSLSETLTRFYPLAGRLKDPLTITCNDEGADYSEAQVLNSSLYEILEKPDREQLKLLLPDDDESPDLTTRPLLIIRVSFFKCDGMALGVKINHKVADAATFCSFINGWADSALGNVNPAATQDFSASTLFPPFTDSLPPPPLPTLIQPNRDKPRASVITCRFVFGPSELATLQAKATSTNNPRPSRVQAVSAFILNILMLSQKESRPSSVIWAVNLRSKLHPPLPDNCFGNLVGNAVHEVGVDDGNGISSLAGYLKRGTINICNDFIQALKGVEPVSGILKIQMSQKDLRAKSDAGSIQLYRITSWCKLPFYETDFGWGKPFWVNNGCFIPIPHIIMLMDTRDGYGIEVMISLTEEEMTLFQSNHEVKNYATFNPRSFN